MEIQSLIAESRIIFQTLDLSSKQDATFCVHRELHESFLLKALLQHNLYPYFECQKPWLLYWMLNSLAVFNKEGSIDDLTRNSLGEYLISF